eukprot:scaffold288_cov108-Isochrysis_galbana.AAC.8
MMLVVGCVVPTRDVPGSPAEQHAPDGRTRGCFNPFPLPPRLTHIHNPRVSPGLGPDSPSYAAHPSLCLCDPCLCGWVRASSVHTHMLNNKSLDSRDEDRRPRVRVAAAATYDQTGLPAS